MAKIEKIAKIEQFGSAAPGGGGGTHDCARYEAMLTDVIDGTLSAEEQAEFDRHAGSCEGCLAMLTDARRGLAWLEMLRPHRPVPAMNLVDRILAETSVRAAREAESARIAHRTAAEAAMLLGRTNGSAPAVSAAPFPANAGNVLPFRSRVPAPFRPALHTVLQTRFAMTAAMAFFSVALTLNLTGVHLSDLHARDLRPANLRRNFYEANAHVVRYYENLRVVYELESRVRDLQHAGDTDASPAATPEPAAPEQNGDGSPAQPASKPSGKPHSGLSGGAESRGSGSGHEPGEREPGTNPDRRPQPRMARRPFSLLSPRGAAVPVSLIHLVPAWQKRGSV